MANLRSFKFFDFSSTEKISNVMLNPSNGECLTIEVNGEDAEGNQVAVSLIVQGKSDLEQKENWYDIAAISLDTYSIKKKINKSGLYMIPITGVTKLRMVSETDVGSFKVYAISNG